MLASGVFGFGILHIANLELLLFYLSDVINKNTSSYAHLVLDNGLFMRISLTISIMYLIFICFSF